MKKIKETFNNLMNEVKNVGIKIRDMVKKYPRWSIVSAVLIVVLIGCLGFMCCFSFNKNSYVPILSVKAELNNNILANNSTFVIETDKDYSVEEVKEIIYLTPAIEYDVKKIGSKKYEIKPTEMLFDNTVYSVGAVRDETVVYRWAFQTQKKLSVASTYPRDGYEYANLDSSIEITFSYADLKNIEDYFEISPNVKGTFSSNRYTHKFHPSEPLKSNTEYTVTIKKGLKNQLSILEEDFSFSFKTGKYSSKDGLWAEYYYANLDESYTFTSDIVPFIQLYNAEAIKKVDVTIYRLSSADQYINNYKIKDNIDYSKLNKLSSFSTALKGDFIVFQNTLAEGHYIINVKADNKSMNVFMQINNLVTYVANLENETLVWVHDYNSGTPLKDVRVNLDGNESKTDAEGIAIVKAKSKAESYSFLKVGINKTVPYVVMVNNYDEKGVPGGYIYSDRTVYKTTDTIKIWGYVPIDRFNGKVTDDFKIELNDWNGSYISKKVKVNSNGLFETEILITDLQADNYSLSITYQGSLLNIRYIEVYNYEKPNYVYTIKTDKKFYNIGDTIVANIEVEHISGIKVPYKKVRVIDEYDTVHHVTTDENGNATLNIKIKTKAESDSVYLDYFQLKISTGDIEETSNYAEIATVGVVNHSVMLDVKQNTDNSLQINTFRTDANILNKKYGTYNYYIPETDYRGAKIERSVIVQIEENMTTKTKVGTKYNPITKTNEPEYEYDFKRNIVDTFNLVTVNGEVILSGLDYQNEVAESYSKYYLAIVTTQDTFKNPIKEYVYIGSDSYHRNYRYFTDTVYSFVFDKPEYSLNDQIDIKLEGSGGYTVAEGGRILSFFYKYGIVEKKVNNSNEISYTYNEKIFPDGVISGAYFDGKRIFEVANQYVNYNQEEQELTIDIKTNKETFTPGSEVTISINVKDKLGKGKKASVNVSVVDEAIFMIAPDETDILGSIYQHSYSYFNYYSFASFYDFYRDEGGAGGGDGGLEGARKDFRDTAHFKTITTDSNGNAMVKIKLPDSTTTWRITAHAVSDTNVGVNTKTINAILPFFIQTKIPNEVKPTDDFVINLTSFGNATGKINYEVIVDNNKQTKQGAFGAFTPFNFGNLAVGNHKIKINGTIGKHKDSVEYEFKVLESFVNIPITSVDLVTNKKLDIKPTSSPVILEFYDPELEFYMKLLNYLGDTKGERVDIELGNQKAAELRNKYYEEKNEINTIKLDKYQTYKGIILLNGSSPDLLLSAMMCKYGRGYIDADQLKSIFYDVIYDKGSSEAQVYQAFVGLSALKEPVLFDLYDLKSNYKKQRQSISELDIYLALAFAYLGDYATALEIYNEMKTFDHPYLTAILTSMIDIGKSRKIINENINKMDYDEYYTFAMIAYIENTIPLLSKKNIINLDLNGKNEKFELNRMMIKKIILDKEDLDSIRISASNKVYVKTTYNGNYKDINSRDLKYQVDAEIKDQVKKGNITKLNINISNVEPKTWGEVAIHLPNGLRLTPEYSPDIQGLYLTKNHNDYLVFNVYSFEKDKITFNLDLLGINVGKFELEPVIYIANNKYGISTSNNIVIN